MLLLKDLPGEAGTARAFRATCATSDAFSAHHLGGLSLMVRASSIAMSKNWRKIRVFFPRAEWVRIGAERRAYPGWTEQRASLIFSLVRNVTLRQCYISKWNFNVSLILFNLPKKTQRSRKSAQALKTCTS